MTIDQFASMNKKNSSAYSYVCAECRFIKKGKKDTLKLNKANITFFFILMISAFYEHAYIVWVTFIYWTWYYKSKYN